MFLLCVTSIPMIFLFPNICSEIKYFLGFFCFFDSTIPHSNTCQFHSTYKLSLFSSAFYFLFPFSLTPNEGSISTSTVSSWITSIQSTSDDKQVHTHTHTHNRYTKTIQTYQSKTWQLTEDTLVNHRLFDNNSLIIEQQLWEIDILTINWRTMKRNIRKAESRDSRKLNSNISKSYAVTLTILPNLPLFRAPVFILRKSCSSDCKIRTMGQENTLDWNRVPNRSGKTKENIFTKFNLVP